MEAPVPLLYELVNRHEWELLTMQLTCMASADVGCALFVLLGCICCGMRVFLCFSNGPFDRRRRMSCHDERSMGACCGEALTLKRTMIVSTRNKRIDEIQ